MIFDKNKKNIKPYLGDYKPLNIYHGRKKVAGYTNKVSTGTNSVVMENTYNEKFEGKVYGNSEQEVREGYNLYDEATYPLEVGSYGITLSKVKIADEEFATGEYTRCNITAVSSTITTGGGPYVGFINHVNLVHGNTYTISAKIRANREITVTATGFPKVECASSYLTRSNNTKITTEWQDVFATFIYDANTQYSGCAFYQQISNYQIGDYIDISCLQVTEGNLKNYELYGASPSIDYPSEIISLDLDNLETYNQNLLMKDGWSTDVNDTDFWNNLSFLAKPLENGWININRDNISGETVLYTNLFTNKKALKNIKPNTYYTALLEFRNLDFVGSTGMRINEFLPTIGESCFDSGEHIRFSDEVQLSGNHYMLFQSREDINKIIGLRSWVAVSANSKVNVDIRLTLVEGDYINKPLRWNKYAENTIQFPIAEPLRALECTSSDDWNIQKDGKYYIADYLDFKKKKVIRRNVKINAKDIANWTKGDLSNDIYSVFQSNIGDITAANYIQQIKIICNKFVYLNNLSIPILNVESVFINPTRWQND